VPQLKRPLERPLWVTVGKDGKLCVPPHYINVEGTREVFNNLEKIVRYDNGIQLENRDSYNVLQNKIEFHLVSQKNEGWIKMDSNSIVIEGEVIGCQITNHHTETVYVSVLEFGETGKINVLFPSRKSSDPLEPGKTVTYGSDYNGVIIDPIFNNMVLKLNEMAKGDVFSVPQVTLKVFVTLIPIDFSPLEHDHYKDWQPEIEKTPLENFFSRALTGRLFPLKPKMTPEHWSTVQRSFVLQSK